MPATYSHMPPLPLAPVPVTQTRSPREDLVDAEQLGGGGAEHGDRFAFGGGVEEFALRHAGPGGGGKPQGRGVDGQRVGVYRRDQRRAVDVRVGCPGGLHLVHAGQPGDHRGGGDRQFGGGAGDALPGLHGEQVGAQRGDFGVQPGRRR
jgi:hypothetical protein